MVDTTVNLSDVVCSLWPHGPQRFVPRVPEQPLEVLEQSVSVLLDKS